MALGLVQAETERLLDRVRGKRPVMQEVPEKTEPSDIDRQDAAVQGKLAEQKGWVGGVPSLLPPDWQPPSVAHTGGGAFKPPAEPQPAQAAAASPAPAAAPAVPPKPVPVESGVLPGEEQVQTQDTFRQLSPAEQSALKAKYETGGHAKTMSYDDWLSENFGELPPQERLASMRQSATSAPRFSVGVDPTLPPGKNSPLADARNAAGKPLPEGREPNQYSPEQRTRMSRNVHNPEVPMTPFGGTFTNTSAEGDVSSRAPNPAMLQTAEAIAADPEQGPNSPSYIVALAQAYNIDARQYGNDIDLLRADVMREKERHDRLAEKYDVVQTPMGGTRYKANPQKMADVQAKKDLAMSPQRKAEFARTIMERHAGLITPEQVAELETFIQTPDGFAQMRALNQKLGRIRALEGGRSWRQKQLNYAMTQQMANPNYAPGMTIRSLMEAVNSRDPMRVAAAFAVMGNQQGVQGAMNLAGREREAAAAVAAAEATERGKQPKPAEPLPKQLRDQLNSALQGPEDGQEREVLTVLSHPGNAAYAKMTPEQRLAEARNIVAGHHYRTHGAAGSEYLQNHLQTLSRNREAFLRFVTSQQGMNLPISQAEAMYDGARSPQQAAAAGAAAMQGIGNWAQRHGSWWGGFFGLNGQSPQSWGGAPPQGPR